MEEWGDPALMANLDAYIRDSEAPDAAPLLKYAGALLAGRRLEELGYLAAYLARACRDRPLWDGALREFVREVGARVQERHGARFAPLGAIEQQLAERGVPVAVE